MQYFPPEFPTCRVWLQAKPTKFKLETSSLLLLNLNAVVSKASIKKTLLVWQQLFLQPAGHLQEVVPRVPPFLHCWVHEAVSTLDPGHPCVLMML